MKFKPLNFAFALILFLFSATGAYADFSFNEMELKFAQLSDVHTSDSEDTTYKVLSHSKELLGSAIKELNNTKGLDFVVFTGDMVNVADKKSYKDFFTILTELNYPVLLVLGNHDTSNANPNEFFNKASLMQLIKRCNPYQQHDTPYFAYSPTSEYRVIVLDTTITDGKTSNGELPEEQMLFLDKELEANQDKVVLIFQHHPVIEPFKSDDHKLINSEQYLQLLKKYEKTPIAVFAGHYHSARIERKGNVIFVASPSLVTYPNAYRTVNITNYNDRVIFDFDFHETSLKNVQEISKRGLLASAVMSGTPNDRYNQIMIRKGVVPKEKLTKAQKAKRKAEKKALKETEQDEKMQLIKE